MIVSCLFLLRLITLDFFQLFLRNRVAASSIRIWQPALFRVFVHEIGVFLLKRYLFRTLLRTYDSC